mmetsp:Transcript_65272/g.146710  ORF Transcript_65272/g.146710 Transcript_65272/m.146710 type:complete len:296 (+) Transcript_65272:1706-2593(+)
MPRRLPKASSCSLKRRSKSRVSWLTDADKASIFSPTSSKSRSFTALPPPSPRAWCREAAMESTRSCKTSKRSRNGGDSCDDGGGFSRRSSARLRHCSSCARRDSAEATASKRSSARLRHSAASASTSMAAAPVRRRCRCTSSPRRSKAASWCLTPASVRSRRSWCFESIASALAEAAGIASSCSSKARSLAARGAEAPSMSWCSASHMPAQDRSNSSCLTGISPLSRADSSRPWRRKRRSCNSPARLDCKPCVSPETRSCMPCNSPVRRSCTPSISPCNCSLTSPCSCSLTSPCN